jgi:hypothetical protein
MKPISLGEKHQMASKVSGNIAAFDHVQNELVRSATNRPRFHNHSGRNGDSRRRFLLTRSGTLSLFVPVTEDTPTLGISLNRMNPRVSGSATSLRRLWTEYKQLTSAGLSYEIALNLIDTI